MENTNVTKGDEATHSFMLDENKPVLDGGGTCLTCAPQSSDEGSVKDGVLLMFSGGYDSILSASRLVAKGKTVFLVTFDTGLIQNVKFREHGVKMLQDKFNVDRKCCVVDMGVKDIVGVYQLLNRQVNNRSFTEMYEEYKAMSMAQVNYLVSRSAMIASAGTLGKKCGHKTIAVGDKVGDVFGSQHQKCLDLQKNMMKQLFGCELITPIWDVQDDFGVMSELSLRGIPTTTLKPQPIAYYAEPGNIIDEARLADDACGAMFSSIMYPAVERFKDSWANVL